MSNQSDNRVIVVTGGSSGLGAAVVEKYVKRGWGVVMNYIMEKEVENVYRNMLQYADESKIVKFRADVSNREQVRAMFDTTIEKFGRVDVLVNCAGINRDAPFTELTDESWDSVVAVHLKGTFVCCQEYVFHNPDNKGTIINIGAACGLEGRKNGANFCSAKAGIIALTKCLALELAPRIQVNCLIPGYFQTKEVIKRYNLENEEALEEVLKTVPLGKLGNLDDFTRIVCTMIETEYITGQNIVINGGQFMP